MKFVLRRRTNRSENAKCIAVIYFCSKCGKKKNCIIDGEVFNCASCKRENECPDDKNFIFRENHDCAFECCLKVDVESIVMNIKRKQVRIRTFDEIVSLMEIELIPGGHDD